MGSHCCARTSIFETARKLAEFFSERQIAGSDSLFEAANAMVSALELFQKDEFDLSSDRQKVALELLQTTNSSLQDMLQAIAAPAEFSWQNQDGQEERLKADRTGPTLVVLWARWCPNCRYELTQITRNAGDLRAAGLDVLAVCVDSLESEEDSEEKNAQDFLKELEFPFVSGSATRDTMASFQDAEETILGRSRPVAIPLSLLVDPDDRIRSLYRGPIEIDRLLEDTNRMDTSTKAELFLAAVPFSGRFARPVSSSEMENSPEYLAAFAQNAMRPPFVIAAIGLIFLLVVVRAYRRARG